MELLKWIGSILLALAGIGIAIAVVGAVLAAGAIVWGSILVFAAIWFTARLIKDLIDSKKPEDL